MLRLLVPGEFALADLLENLLEGVFAEWGKVTNLLAIRLAVFGDDAIH